MTAQERVFIGALARSGDHIYAADKAGYAQPARDAARNLARPAVKAEVLRQSEAMLRDEFLPLAFAALRRLLTVPATPAGAVLGAAKLVIDRTMGVDESKADKEPSEMTYDELTGTIDTLRREQEARADQARDITPEQASEADASTVFD